jgi:hypothetical protein
MSGGTRWFDARKVPMCAATRGEGNLLHMSTPRKLPRKFTMPWGNGQVVDEVGVETEHNELVIQLLRYDDHPGDTLRFCQYWLDGRFQRQPMMISEDHLDDVREALRASPQIRALLKRLVDG